MISDIPTQLSDMPFKDWQINITTVGLAVMLIGRAYKAIRTGGGLRGLYRGLVYGENAPVDKTTETKE